MAVNSSSSNDSLRYPKPPQGLYCFFTWPGSLIYSTCSIITILVLLPLCILVLQQWWQQRSASTAPTMSHSDTFTYHMVTLELIGVFGCTLNCCGIYADQFNVFFAGNILWSLSWHGETFFHILTCVERYLAVVHPVTYLSLRRERGIRIRNITVGCIWLLCFGETSVAFSTNIYATVEFCLLIFSLIVVTFCSLSILRILIRPGPGEKGGDRERGDQSKRRAFYTIVAILGVLLLRCFANLVWVIPTVLMESLGCETTALVWFNLPSSLVLPLLFLQRAGTLACFKKQPK